jgi:FMN phosphatase YigB (HAD superfamily)
MALPMPKPTNPPLALLQYQVLSFDVYGSLIEYKAHILDAFHPLLSRLPPSSPFLNSDPLSSTIPNSATKGSIEFLKLFQRQEDAIKLEKPVKRFDQILQEIWTRVAKEINVETSEDEARRFGSQAVIASWPTFPGTLDALKTLSKYFKLVALSNIDRYAWDITASSATSRLGEVEWWKVFTAEDFGDDVSRADDAKLETLIRYCAEQGVKKEEILHVAQSLGHDQAPAKRLGLSSVWLIGDGPRWGKEAESQMALGKELVGYAWRFQDLRGFADEVVRVAEAEKN